MLPRSNVSFSKTGQNKTIAMPVLTFATVLNFNLLNLLYENFMSLRPGVIKQNKLGGGGAQKRQNCTLHFWCRHA